MTFKFSVPVHFKTPKRLAKNPRLTIAQVINRVPQSVLAKSRKVGIREVKVGRTPNYLAGYTTYKFVTQNTENGHSYKITIFSPTPKVTNASKIIIDDPCAVFVFKYEYAMARRGNAYIYRTNGDPPIRTNPRLLPGYSHHGLAALRYLIRNTNKNGLRT